jgi:mRNA interferase MazF
MMSTTSFEFGDIVLLPFRFTNQTQVKRRPAVVVSCSAYHDRCADVIVMAVTSQLRTVPLPGERFLSRWEAVGLLYPSVTKPVLMTVQKSLIDKKLGRLREPDLQAVAGALEEILGEEYASD